MAQRDQGEGETEADGLGSRWPGTTVGYLQSIVAVDLRGGGAERTGGGLSVIELSTIEEVTSKIL